MTPALCFLTPLRPSRRSGVRSLLIGGCLLAAAVPGTAGILTNGDFETGSGSGTTRTFAETDGWYNRGLGNDQNQVARRNNEPLASGFIGQINDRYNASTFGDFDKSGFGAVVHSLKTSYTILGGDSFEFSYDWQDRFNWEDAADELRFVLFATSDDTLGGAVLWSSVHDSGYSILDGAFEHVSGTSSVVAGSAVGRILFVNFFGIQSNGSLSADTGFAGIDNITLNAVPEPGSLLALLGLVASTLLVVRRRR